MTPCEGEALSTINNDVDDFKYLEEEESK
jgi:hypothetical protein